MFPCQLAEAEVFESYVNYNKPVLMPQLGIFFLLSFQG